MERSFKKIKIETQSKLSISPPEMRFHPHKRGWRQGKQQKKK